MVTISAIEDSPSKHITSYDVSIFWEQTFLKKLKA